jgi:ABC-type nitrate/sulfonate/bicarbonate transport system ATPase subunit
MSGWRLDPDQFRSAGGSNPPPRAPLDRVMADELQDEILRFWRETRKTIIMVSYNFEEAPYLADRVEVAFAPQVRSRPTHGAAPVHAGPARP